MQLPHLLRQAHRRRGAASQRVTATGADDDANYDADDDADAQPRKRQKTAVAPSPLNWRAKARSALIATGNPKLVRLFIVVHVASLLFSYICFCCFVNRWRSLGKSRNGRGTGVARN